MSTFYFMLLFFITISTSANGEYLANFDDLYYGCPQGWLPYGNGQCIQKSPIKLDFDSAKSYCEQNNSHLVTIPTNPQRLAIDAYLLYDNSMNESYWLGLQRNNYGRMHWVTDKYLTVGYSFWDENQPSNITTDQCGALNKVVDKPGVWQLRNCSEQRFFICQRRGYRSSFTRMMAPAQEGTVDKVCPGNWTQQGHLCFRRFFNPEWFIHARSICQYYGADLGVIDSIDTQQQIDQFLGKEWLMWTWIGLYRDTSAENSPFKWVINGKETTYFNWAQGHPLPDRNCAVLKRVVNGKSVDWKWFSLDCMGTFSSFLCMKNLNDSYPSANYKDLTQNLTQASNVYNVSTDVALNASEVIGSTLAQNLASIQSPISSTTFSQTARLYIVSKSEAVNDITGSIKINMTSASNYLLQNTIRHIEIPKSVVPQNYKGYVGIVSIAFLPSEKNFSANGTTLNHSIVSLNVYPKITEKFPEPVRLVFDVTDEEKNSNIQCVYWKSSGNNTGHWSTDGVTTRVMNSSAVSCETEHLSSFTILVGMSQAKLPSIHKRILDIMTKAGLSLSLFGLVVTFLTYAFIKQLRGIRGYVHANLSLALIAATVIFLFGADATSNQRICQIIAIALHYLYLAVFFWMLVEGILTYMSSANYRHARKHYYLYFAIGWLFPAFIVGLSAIMKIEDYGSQESCYISPNSILIWAFIGPVSAILTINIILMIMVIKTLISIRAVSSRSDTYKIKTAVRAVLVLMPIFGLSWLFGFLSIGDRSLVFSYIFVISNSLQGVFIFKFHCLNNKDVVRYFSRILRTKRTRGSIASQLAARELAPRPIPGSSNRSFSQDATFSKGRFTGPPAQTQETGT